MTLQWHCYPPGPPSRLTLERLTTRSSTLTFHGRALNSGPLHPVVSGQHRGTPRSNIRAKPTTTSPPCRPDASVSPLQVPAAAASGLAYGFGFVAATALLHAAGIGIGRLAGRPGDALGRPALQVAGAGLTAAGAVLLVGAL